MIESLSGPREGLALPPWSQAERSVPQELPLVWISGRRAEFMGLRGWRAPLWRRVEDGVEILRPEGRWFARAPETEFLMVEAGADGWLSKRGIWIPQSETLSGAWRDQHGVAQRISELDATGVPEGLEGIATGRGELARWELSEDGRAVAWLDDSFERGPFACRRRAQWLIVSDGAKKIAYWVGQNHWAWPMMERGMLSLLTGRGGGWETEREHRPIVMA
jgi:hypothetical protein